MSDSEQEIVVYKHSSTGGKPDVVITTKSQLEDLINSGATSSYAHEHRSTPLTAPPNPHNNTFHHLPKTAQLTSPPRTDSSIRVSRKPIPRGHRHVEIFQRDIMPETERAAHAHYPNMGSSIASVTLPNRVWMQRQLTARQFSELHILSVSATAPRLCVR
ncbi:hypothetical protein GTA08_BOTSDO00938 [Neofusicoccum parvum]|nr:hypothetical protein GTA08_BOTSDO00938 [Neofusicoccum parvum]